MNPIEADLAAEINARTDGKGAEVVFDLATELRGVSSSELLKSDKYQRQFQTKFVGRARLNARVKLSAPVKHDGRRAVIRCSVRQCLQCGKIELSLQLRQWPLLMGGSVTHDAPVVMVIGHFTRVDHDDVDLPRQFSSQQCQPVFGLRRDGN